VVEGLGPAEGKLGDLVVAPADVVGVLECAVAALGGTVVVVPGRTAVVVPGGTVEEQAAGGVARDQPGVAGAQPAIAEEVRVTPFSSLAFAGELRELPPSQIVYLNPPEANYLGPLGLVGAFLSSFPCTCIHKEWLSNDISVSISLRCYCVRDGSEEMRL